MSANTEWAAIVRKLESELAEVTKRRDELTRAIRKHKQALAFKAIRKHKAGLAFTLGDCDVELYKALEEVRP